MTGPLSRSTLSRRTLLRGLGVSLGLPMLEAMTPRRLLGKAPTVAPPLRLAYIFVPGGVNVDLTVNTKTTKINEPVTLSAPK